MGRARGVPEDRSACRDAGAAAVEFALVAPLLIALLFMTFGAGWGLWELQATRATVREAARLAAVGIPDLAAFKQAVICLGERNGMRKGALTQLELSFHADGTSTGLATKSAGAPGGYVLVRLTYRSALHGVIYSPFTSDDGSIQAATVTRIEQVGLADVKSEQTVPISGEVCA